MEHATTDTQRAEQTDDAEQARPAKNAEPNPILVRAFLFCCCCLCFISAMVPAVVYSDQIIDNLKPFFGQTNASVAFWLMAVGVAILPCCLIACGATINACRRMNVAGNQADRASQGLLVNDMQQGYGTGNDVESSYSNVATSIFVVIDGQPTIEGKDEAQIPSGFTQVFQPFPNPNGQDAQPSFPNPSSQGERRDNETNPDLLASAPFLTN